MTSSYLPSEMSKNDPRHIPVDPEGMELMQHVLSNAGYSTRTDGTQEPLSLVAENADNFVVAIATPTVADLVRAEPVVTARLVELLIAGGASNKKWDGYAVLLTNQPAQQELTELLFGLTYNLRQVRRLIKVGVEPTLAGFARALRPVLPMGNEARAEMARDPLTALEETMVTAGADPGLVGHTFADFRARYKLSRDGEATELMLPGTEFEGIDGIE